MELRNSDISCGVLQLCDVGKNPTMTSYKQAMADAEYDNNLGCFIISSVPWSWKESIKFLKSVGFESSRVRKNPNSGNKIVLLTKSISKKETRELLGRFCEDCNDQIPTRRKVCDVCKKGRKEERKSRGTWRWR